MESPPGSARLSRRLREQFAPAYLAITGLVQVLVLDALIAKVEGGYTDYGAVEWLVALLGVAAWAQRNLRIRQFADEERDISPALATRHWYRPALAVAVTAFGLLGWLLYDTLGLASARLAVALVGLGGVVVIIASSVPMWNEILRYAQGGPAGGDRSGPAPGTERS